MKRLATYLLFTLLATAATGQIAVNGTVADAAGGEPLTGASVVYRNAEGKIKRFATTDGKGQFELSVNTLTGCRVEVSMMSYARQSFALDSVALPLNVRLQPEAFRLKEVAVKADRIREQGDTISYSVGGFAQKQDRTIGDVLRRMPGIDVEKSGKIKYQGEDINKFYIEGADMLGGRYGLATNGISHEDVGAVEVMENHQPMQVLSGISFSDKAAINLKLKNKAKATWSVYGDAAAGYSGNPEGMLWDGGIFALAAMPKFQSLVTVKSNNRGRELSSQLTDFFSDRRKTDIRPYVSVGLPSVPSLERNRTLFNRSAIISANGLWKTGDSELKAAIDYSYNRLTADAANITTYFLTGEDKVITENRHGIDRNHALSGKVTYESNRKTAFINNTLKADIGWNDVSLRVTGSLPVDQSATLPDYYVSNSFDMIKRFGDKHLVTIKSDVEWESQPQTLTVDNTGATTRQHVGDHAFYTKERAAYVFLIKNVTLSLEGGIKGYLRKMESDLSGISDATDDGRTVTDVVHTDYFGVFASQKLEYRLRRVNFTLDAPISFARYGFDKAIADRSEFYFSPSLSLDWKPNNRLSAQVRGRAGRSPMNLNMIHPAAIMTDYRSFRRGVDDFYNPTSQSLSALFAYKNIRRGLFVNASVMHAWSHMPYTLIQQIYGDYIVYSYATANSDSRNLIAAAKIGKALEFMRGSANVNGTFTRAESHLFSGDEAVNSVTTGWSAGLTVSGTPLRWLSFDYSFRYSTRRLSMNGTDASWLGDIENSLLINIMPHKKWEWHISGEHYRNEITGNTFKNTVLLDSRLIYKTSKRIELSAGLSNILDRRSYNYTVYNQLNSFESRRYLRGRELLISITIRK